MDKVKILIAGDSAVTVEFAREISPEINGYVKAFAVSLEENHIKGVTECIPTFRSVLVCYDPLKISYREIVKRLEKRLSSLNVSNEAERKLIRIPVCYGGEYGEDMENVCSHTGLSESEVISLHSGADYLIYMLGFLPGFAYLGGMDPRLFTPRLKNPRTKIPVGSVGIGGEQTGIYPLASPGGWQLIGRTPVKPYEAGRTPSILYEAGDYIRFFPITKKEYSEIEELVKRGEYKCETGVK